MGLIFKPFKIEGKYFSENANSEKYENKIESISVSISEPNEAGDYPVQVGDIYHDFNPCFQITDNFDNRKPTLIIIPDICEFKSGKMYDNVFKDYIEYNKIIYHPPFSNSMKNYSFSCHDLDKYISSFCVSIQSIEKMVSMLKKKGTSEIAVIGIGYGGWICNLHHAVHNSVKIYVPYYVGSGLGNVLMDSPANSYVSSKAKENYRHVLNVLNFDDLFLSGGRHNNVFPVLCKKDKYLLYMRQSSTYGDIDIATIDSDYESALKNYKKIKLHFERIKLNITKKFL